MPKPPINRALRAGHAILFSLIVTVAAVSMAISLSLIEFFDDNGYPSSTIRDRIRINLVASIWTLPGSVYLLVGVLLRADSLFFGILIHLIFLFFSFALYLIGAATLTAAIIFVDCCSPTEGFRRCDTVNGLMIVGWIETVLVFIGLVTIFFVGVNTRGHGIRGSTLVDF